MVKLLIIFGASNFGDEIVQLFRDVNASRPGPEWEIVGFLDDDPEKAGTVRNGIEVLGSRSWLEDNSPGELYFVCAIGNPKVKVDVIDALIAKGARFATAIHPSVVRTDTTSFGQGCMITAGNILTTNVAVGDHVILNLACTVGHHTTIGDFSTINPGANISGDVILAEGVFVGTSACILEKLTIGEYATIGAGAVVTKNVPARVTAVGVPARAIRRHSD